MKKIVVFVAAITLSLTACHYGKEEAQDSLKRNKEYQEKNVEQGPAINPDYVTGKSTPTDTIVKSSGGDTATAAPTKN